MGKKMFDINNNGGFNDKKRFIFIGCLLSIIPLSIVLPIVIIKTNKNKEFQSNYEISQSIREAAKANEKLILDYMKTIKNVIAKENVSAEGRAYIDSVHEAIKDGKITEKEKLYIKNKIANIKNIYESEVEEN